MSENISCGITGLSITPGEEVIFIPIFKTHSDEIAIYPTSSVRIIPFILEGVHDGYGKIKVKKTERSDYVLNIISGILNSLTRSDKFSKNFTWNKFFKKSSEFYQVSYGMNLTCSIFKKSSFNKVINQFSYEGALGPIDYNDPQMNCEFGLVDINIHRKNIMLEYKDTLEYHFKNGKNVDLYRKFKMIFSGSMEFAAIPLPSFEAVYKDITDEDIDCFSTIIFLNYFFQSIQKEWPVYMTVSDDQDDEAFKFLVKIIQDEIG